MEQTRARANVLLLVAAAGALLAACVPAPVRQDTAPAPAPVQPGIVIVPPAPQVPPPPGQVVPERSRGSMAATEREYRRDAAAHLYALNRERIYAGRLPPMLYAVGVLQLDVDNRGQLRRLHWLRAPRHAPEVIAEIERTVRAAAPFPAPVRLGRATYTETWLWDRSGRFQLDTLTEGQD